MEVYDDQLTWDMLKEGYTKGIFQLDNQANWTKKVAPNSIGELADLLSIIRPGCTKAMLDGKNMTQHYVDRKHGREEVTYLDDSLEEILESTYGVLVYQEQAMRIAQKLAGFNLEEADNLRKAIGKKKADLMEKVKTEFIAGCETTGMVNSYKAEEIFGWIEKSARYSFNKSHAVAYAVNAYNAAFRKAHKPRCFYASYLSYSKSKIDPHEEVHELVNDAKFKQIDISLPIIGDFTEDFDISKGTIHFGIKNIKSLTGVQGDKVIQAITDLEQELGKDSGQFTWMEILTKLSPKINSRCFRTLCTTGFFRNEVCRIARTRALYEYSSYKLITKGEQKWIDANFEDKWESVLDCFKALAPTKQKGGGTHSVNRQQVIENEMYVLINPPHELTDDPLWIATEEAKLVGCPISISKIESSDTSASNTSCRDIVNGKTGKDLCVAGNITRVADHKIKKQGKNFGKLMSFLTIEDEQCSLEGVIVFPDTREKYNFMLYEGNNVLLCGDINMGETSLIVSKMYEI